MKKVLLLYGLLVAVLLVLYLVKNGGANFLFEKVASVQIKEHKFSLKVADSEKERMLGLTKTSSLKENEGMIFVFPKKSQYSFWTKGMKFPIDIIYVSDDTIVDIYKNISPKDSSGKISIINTNMQANYVIELKGGSADKYGITSGTIVKFSNL